MEIYSQSLLNFLRCLLEFPSLSLFSNKFFFLFPRSGWGQGRGGTCCTRAAGGTLWSGLLPGAGNGTHAFHPGTFLPLIRAAVMQGEVALTKCQEINPHMCMGSNRSYGWISDREEMATAKTVLYIVIRDVRNTSFNPNSGKPLDCE